MLRPFIAALFLLLAQPCLSARDGKAAWDSRWEECHGDPSRFARRYLWNVEGKLQGQHHVDNLDVFLRKHYLPQHEIEIITDMLLTQANDINRFAGECGGCHGEARAYVDSRLWITNGGITVITTGKEVSAILPDHQQLQLPPEDVIFYLRLLSRVAGKAYVGDRNEVIQELR